ncbi:MAG TPA: serine/threonine-protein kinase [Solirubrobacteraceae bacterium]|nr:serine/threonine-protein kinase [Solirubrobacteraceae bacterium]
MQRHSQIDTAAGWDNPDIPATSSGETAEFVVAREPTAADPAPGEDLLLGRYRVGRRLGSGGFATVYAARDERLDRPVAVKVLPRERVIHSRFAREARAAARLHHPHIVTLFEAAVDDDGAYLVSELVKGTTLAGALELGELSDRDILEVAIALAEALEHAHANDVVHRDVKPQNVLIPNRRGRDDAGGLSPAKLTDFGVAQVVGGDALTRTGDVVGTAAYMSPEQAEGASTGPETDLYSLALLTYEALTGVNPVVELIRRGRGRRLGTYLPPLRRQRADLPRRLGAAVDQALRPRPSERGGLVDLRSALIECLPLVNDRPGVVAPARALTITHAGDPGAGHAATDRSARRGRGPAPTRRSVSPRTGSRVVTPTRVRTRETAAVVTRRRGTATAPPEPPLAGRGRSRGIAPRGLLLAGLALGAVALGAVGLAPAWPAVVAASIRGPLRRAALGALGWAWIGVAGALTTQNFLYRVGALSARTLAPVGIAAAVWALTAAVAPWLIRGRRPLLDLGVATLLALGAGLGVALAGPPHTTGLLAGGLVAWLVWSHRALVGVLSHVLAARRLA